MADPALNPLSAQIHVNSHSGTNTSTSGPPIAVGAGVGIPNTGKKKPLKKIFEKKFVGFQFSTPDVNQSLLGMLYQSRIPKNDSKPITDNEENAPNFNLSEMSSSQTSTFGSDADESDDDEHDAQAHKMNPRQ